MRSCPSDERASQVRICCLIAARLGSTEEAAAVASFVRLGKGYSSAIEHYFHCPCSEDSVPDSAEHALLSLEALWGRKTQTFVLGCELHSRCYSALRPVR